MNLRDLEKKANKRVREINDCLEEAYRKDERIRDFKHIRHEMIMLEHRKDLKTIEKRWDELKSHVEMLIKKWGED